MEGIEVSIIIVLLAVVAGFYLKQIVPRLYLRIVAPKRLEFIKRYSFDFASKEKLLELHPNLAPHEIERVFDCLRQFFTIAHYSQQRKIAMPSRVVDDAWHQFILSTAEYSSFCKNAFGRLYNHEPSSPVASPENIAHSVKRTWVIACRMENIDPRNPRRVPLIFAIDSTLKIVDGNNYELIEKKLGEIENTKRLSGTNGDPVLLANSDIELSGLDLSCGGISCGGGSCGGGSCGGS